MAIPTIKILFPVSSIVELETNLILVSHFSFPNSVLASLYPVRAMPSSACFTPFISLNFTPGYHLSQGSQLVLCLRVPSPFDYGKE